MIYPRHTFTEREREWKHVFVHLFARSFDIIKSAAAASHPQMCAYFNLNMLYHHQRITKYIYCRPFVCFLFNHTKHPILCGHKAPLFFLSLFPIFFCSVVFVCAFHCWFLSHSLQLMMSCIFLTLNENWPQPENKPLNSGSHEFQGYAGIFISFDVISFFLFFLVLFS